MNPLPAPANDAAPGSEQEHSRQASPILASRWFILAVLVLARTAVAFQFQSVAAVGPLLVEELRIDFALLGLIVGLYMLPGIVIAPPGGLLGQRFGDKRVAVVGLSLMTLGGLATGLSGDATLFVASRIVSGVGAIFLNVLLAKMVADWFAVRDTAIAMGFFLMSWPIGLGLALVTLAPLSATFGSGLPLILTALTSAVALVLMTAFYHPPVGLPKQTGSFRIELTGREWSLTLLAGIIYASFNLGFVLALVFGPSFLFDTGYSHAQAGMITSVALWTCAPALILGGYIGERFNKPNTIMATCFILGAASVGGVATGIMPLLWFALLGLLVGLPAGLSMKLPVTVLDPRNRSVGMGIFLACFYAGMAALPAVAGLLREETGNPTAPLWLASGTFVAAALSLALFRAVQGR